MLFIVFIGADFAVSSINYHHHHSLSAGVLLSLKTNKIIPTVTLSIRPHSFDRVGLTLPDSFGFLVNLNFR